MTKKWFDTTYDKMRGYCYVTSMNTLHETKSRCTETSIYYEIMSMLISEFLHFIMMPTVKKA